MNQEQRLLDISQIIERIPPAKRNNGARVLIERAYDVAELAHAGQLRKSGEPYIQHPLAVALSLAELGMDADTIAAGLLHDVLEDNEHTDLTKLRNVFGPRIARLVDGVTKLEKVEEQIKQEHAERLTQHSERRRSQKEIESLRKMFFAMSEDIRVVIIKLADRLHNMRTLEALAPERRRSFAHETMEIFAPLSEQLGIWQWKCELEDLSFFHLDRAAYDEIALFLRDSYQQCEMSVHQHITKLGQALDNEGIEAEITGRQKHIYSIYRKMRRKRVSLPQIYDLRGVRVVIYRQIDHEDLPIPQPHNPRGHRQLTPTELECYRALGVVHGLWKPILHEFDDYIAVPKGNGYKSIHTAVIGDDGKTLEVQIRDLEMHRTAEYGIAAHWRYKDGSESDPEFAEQISRMRSAVEWHRDTPDADDFLDAMQTDVCQDRVYTFTPKGKLVDLPAGSTPIDFAYYIHTEIGHRCRGARVNEKMVSLDYQLKNGDRVEILTGKHERPSRDWLNPSLGYVKTARARAKIRQWFRHQDREQNIAEGKEIVNRELRRLGVEHLSHEALAQLFGYEDVEQFLAAVGYGDITSQQIASKIEATRERERESFPISPPSPPAPILEIQGTGGSLSRLARCCNPLPGDEIIGYVTRGRGVSVHRRDCRNILNMVGEEHERLIEVKWGARTETVPVMIYIRAYDRMGLLNEITSIIGAEEINIASLNQTVKDHIARLYITIEISNIAQLSRILDKIEQRPNVIEAHRHTG